MDGISFKNGSYIQPISSTASTHNNVGNRGRKFTFFCKNCNMIHAGVPLADIYCIKGEWFCKQSVDKLINT